MLIDTRGGITDCSFNQLLDFDMHGARALYLYIMIRFFTSMSIYHI